jgi:hypothetical protein
MEPPLPIVQPAEVWSVIAVVRVKLNIRVTKSDGGRTIGTVIVDPFDDINFAVCGPAVLCKFTSATMQRDAMRDSYHWWSRQRARCHNPVG